MIKTLSFALLFTLLSLQASAAITNLNISGVSRFTAATSTATPIIFGGLAGAFLCPDTSATCNNCDGTYTQCNEARIGDSVVAKITFVSAISGTVLVTKDDDKTEITPKSSSDTSATAGQTITVELFWGDICDIDEAAVGGCSPGAGGLFNGSFKVGVTKGSSREFESGDESQKISFQVYQPDLTTNSCLVANPEKGLCDFEIKAGDEKVIITDRKTINSNASEVSEADFVVTGLINIEAVRFMYSEVSFDSTSPGFDFVDLLVVNKDTLSQDTITGLKNDTNYIFSFANIDTAGNVSYLMDSTSLGCAGITAATNIAGSSVVDITNCPYTARPQIVVGLLGEDLNCFIATAAYGTHFSAKLNTLRAFRNQFLLTNRPGLLFVKWYYKYGSQGSHYIKESSFLKILTQVLLWPLWAFSYLALNLGLIMAFILSFFSLYTLFIIAKRVRRTKRRALC